MKQKIVWPNIYKMEQPIIEKPKTYATMIHDETIILSDLLDSVYVHDYSYIMSDDMRAWTRGNSNECHIKDLIDILITELCVKPIDLLRQLLECRSEQYTDGLTHKTIKGWFAIYM
jgi:hypothetical protein